VRSCQHLTQTPSCRTTPCQLSATAYTIYSQLPPYWTYWRLFHPPQPEDKSCRGDRDPTYPGHSPIYLHEMHNDNFTFHNDNQRK